MDRVTAGVTLVELVITLAIASILVTLAVPSFNAALATNRVAGLTNSLTAAFNLARTEAITRGTTVTVCRSADTETAIDNSASPTTGPSCATSAATGWQDGWLVFVDGGTRGTVDGTDIRLRVGKPAESSAVIDGSSTADTDSTNGNFDLYISYLPSGASRGNGGLGNGTLHICSPPGKRRDIVINTTGRIRVATPADAACP